MGSSPTTVGRVAVSQSLLATILGREKVFPAEELEAYAAQAAKANRPLWDILLSENQIAEDQLAETLARRLRLPCVRLAAAVIEPAVIKRLPEEIAVQNVCIPVNIEEAAPSAAGKSKVRPTLLLAMVDPSDLGLIESIEFATGMRVKPAVSTRTEIGDAIGRFYSPDLWLTRFLQGVPETETVEVTPVDPEAEESSSGSSKVESVVKLVNLILQRGVAAGASDLHIEPTTDEVYVRLRREGMLTDLMKLPKWLLESVVSRLKIMAKLNIADRRRPQDGSLRVTFGNQPVDMRVSTLPTCFGEKVVVRVLSSGAKLPSLDTLGMSADEMGIMRRASLQPQGMVLVTGPTGSGKTTTLYSVLAENADTTKNIVTVEDPVEINLPRANQVQVNVAAGLTFASALRSILRQDPDIVLIGEIRDTETAEIAFNAAMTGRLVFSTLHTNSTISTITRLLDLNVDPFRVSSALSLVIAQRLARKICTKCREVYEPPAALKQKFGLDNIDMVYYHGRGCEACNQSGYAGRVAFYEMLNFTPTVRRLISEKASESDLLRAAGGQGMVTLLQRGVEVVRQGITTLDEVARVVQMQEDEVSFCPQCARALHPDFTVCPFCLHEFRTLCAGCKQELRADWKICPYCHIPVGQRGSEVGEIVEAVSHPLAPPPSVPPAAVPPDSVPPDSVTLDSVTPDSVTATSVTTTSVTSVMPDIIRGSAQFDLEWGGESPSQPVHVRRPLILVVDDDPAIRLVSAAALEKLPEQPEVLEAADGEEALALVGTRQPDAILLDIDMPGLDGFEVCAKLRANVQTAFIPIVMLTASVDEASRSKGFLVGTDDYMIKPVSVPELHARVKRLLRRTYGM